MKSPIPGFFVSVSKTQSERFVVIHTHDHETSEAWLIPDDAPESEPQLVARRETGVEYSVEEAAGNLVILTNAAGAKDFKIATAPADSRSRDNWIDLVPHEAGRFILAMSAYADHLVRLERAEGLPRIVIRRLADGAEHTIAFDEEAYSLALNAGYEFDTTTLRFTYSSLATPPRVYDYDMETPRRAFSARSRKSPPVTTRPST